MEHFMNKLPYNLGIKLDNDETNLLKEWIEVIIKNHESNTGKKYTRSDMAISYDEGKIVAMNLLNDFLQSDSNEDVLTLKFKDFINNVKT